MSSPRPRSRRPTRSRGRPTRRTCVGCRRVAGPDELVRLRLEPEGTIAVGAGPGRGVWLCGLPATLQCLDQALRRRALDRALGTIVRSPEATRLRAKLEHMSG